MLEAAPRASVVTSMAVPVNVTPNGAPLDTGVANEPQPSPKQPDVSPVM